MPQSFPSHPTEFCITDVGSTTTKAILFRKDAAWSFLRREAPTTVEKPDEDVGVGVRNAFRALEAQSGMTLLKDGVPAVPYLSTSSAGGGLAMVVTGLVREVTSRSAERVALGAGSILLDVVAMNDGRTPYEKIEALKSLRPDMILLAGGFDGEAISGPVYLAELILEAGLRPKLSESADLPVVYAGRQARGRFSARSWQRPCWRRRRCMSTVLCGDRHSSATSACPCGRRRFGWSATTSGSGWGRATSAGASSSTNRVRTWPGRMQLT